jgi:hypothetical protein
MLFRVVAQLQALVSQLEAIAVNEQSHKRHSTGLVAVDSILFSWAFFCIVSFESSALYYSVKHAVHHALSACASRSSADAPVSSSEPSPAPVTLSHALATAARLLQSVPLVFARALTKSLQQASEEFAQLESQLGKVTALAHSQLPTCSAFFAEFSHHFVSFSFFLFSRRVNPPRLPQITGHPHLEMVIAGFYILPLTWSQTESEISRATLRVRD